MRMDGSFSLVLMRSSLPSLTLTPKSFRVTPGTKWYDTARQRNTNGMGGTVARCRQNQLFVWMDGCMCALGGEGGRVARVV